MPLQGQGIVFMAVFMPIRIYISLLSLLVLTACGGNGPAFSTTGPEATFRSPGPYKVSKISDHPIDDSIRGRQFSATIWYPTETDKGKASPGQLPVVIYSHGFSGSPTEMEYLTAHLASHGFLVIAPKFPFTSGRDPEKTDTNDIVNQPGDISFLLDAALGSNDAFPPFLRQLADPDRIALSGLSYGGLTTYFASYDAELRDPRVKLAIVIAGAGGELFEPLFYDSAKVPLFLVYGTADGFVDYKNTALKAFRNANHPKSLLTLKYGSHLGFIETGFLSSMPVNMDSIVCKLYPVDQEYEGEAPPFYITLRNRHPDTGIGTTEFIGPCSFGAEKQGHMATKRQHEFTKIGVTAALQSHLNKSAEQRQVANHFLTNEFNQGQDDATLRSQR